MPHDPRIIRSKASRTLISDLGLNNDTKIFLREYMRSSTFVNTVRSVAPVKFIILDSSECNFPLAMLDHGSRIIKINSVVGKDIRLLKVVFEMCNLKRVKAITSIKQLAANGIISCEEYVCMMEYLEYESLKEANNLTGMIHHELGITSTQAYKIFAWKTHYDLQQTKDYDNGISHSDQFRHYYTSCWPDAIDTGYCFRENVVKTLFKEFGLSY